MFLLDNEPDPGRDGLSSAVMQLRVERCAPLESSSTPTSPDSGRKYPPLPWRVIEDGFQGVYGLSDDLKARLNQRVQLTGVVYTHCGGGLYVRPERDKDADCLLPDAPAHIELVDDKRQPLPRLADLPGCALPSP